MINVNIIRLIIINDKSRENIKLFGESSVTGKTNNLTPILHFLSIIFNVYIYYDFVVIF